MKNKNILWCKREKKWKQWTCAAVLLCCCAAVQRWFFCVTYFQGFRILDKAVELTTAGRRGWSGVSCRLVSSTRGAGRRASRCLVGTNRAGRTCHVGDSIWSIADITNCAKQRGHKTHFQRNTRKDFLSHFPFVWRTNARIVVSMSGTKTLTAICCCCGTCWCCCFTGVTSGAAGLPDCRLIITNQTSRARAGCPRRASLTFCETQKYFQPNKAAQTFLDQTVLTRGEQLLSSQKFTLFVQLKSNRSYCIRMPTKHLGRWWCCQ